MPMPRRARLTDAKPVAAGHLILVVGINKIGHKLVDALKQVRL
ncbi:MAG: hypothetical protein WCF90_09295 [Methanomicrobiales archaeon]